MKAILKHEAVNAYIDLHKKLGIPFTLTISSYTSRITSAAYDITFMKTAQPVRVFSTFARIKKEVLKKPVPVIDKSALTYFNVKPLYEDFYADKILAIDIKAAYATALKIGGYITGETLKLLNKLPKQERLTVVGMLAGKKDVFGIDKKGNIKTKETIISPTANYFFYCVQKVAEVMAGAAYIMQDEFLFSWVDCIYFSEVYSTSFKKKEMLLHEYFYSEGYKITVEELKEFEITNLKNYYKASYIKGEKRKTFNIPKPDNTISKKIYNHLINKDYL